MNFKINSFKVATKLLLFSSSLFAGATYALPHAPYVQEVQTTVKGSVKDEQGNPLVGATVSVKGSTISTSTDTNGAFTLSNVGKNAVIIIRMVGFNTKEIPYSGGSSVDVQLVSDTQQLEEAVVVGYGSLDKKELTSAVSSIKQKDMVAGAVSPLLAIQGKVPGRQQQPSTKPGILKITKTFFFKEKSLAFQIV